MSRESRLMHRNNTLDQHALTQSESTGRNDSTGQVGLPLTMPSSSQSPAFDPAHITVIYVLGGPGAGKGTQCAKLVEHQDFVHLSAGDLLRTEQNRQGSKTGQMIKEYITEGKIVPSEVTIGLLRTAMGEAIDKQGKHRFLIDGFPRKLDQAHAFDETVSAIVLYANERKSDSPHLCFRSVLDLQCCS